MSSYEKSTLGISIEKEMSAILALNVSSRPDAIAKLAKANPQQQEGECSLNCVTHSSQTYI